MAKATSTNSLSAALKGLDDTPHGGIPVSGDIITKDTPARELPPIAEEITLGAKASKKSEETVLVGAHFPPEMAKRLRILAAEEGKTNKALIQEALNLLFKKKGIQPFH